MVGALLAPWTGQVQAGATAPSLKLLQVGARDKATLPVPLHCPPAILPFLDDLQDVPRRDVQLVGILGKRMKTHLAEVGLLGGPLVRRSPNPRQ